MRLAVQILMWNKMTAEGPSLCPHVTRTLADCFLKDQENDRKVVILLRPETKIVLDDGDIFYCF